MPSAWVALEGLEEARLPELHLDELPEGNVCLRLRVREVDGGWLWSCPLPLGYTFVWLVG